MSLLRCHVEGSLFRVFVVIFSLAGFGCGNGFRPTATTTIRGCGIHRASCPRWSQCFRFVQPPKKCLLISFSASLSSSSLQFSLDLQSDTSRFGRGENHLSAFLEEGNVVAYQTGSWLVDGVLVGDGSPPRIEYCCIDTIQVVWTHNCEHGVLRGHSLIKTNIHSDHPPNSDDDGQNTPKQVLVGSIHDDNDMVEFGPEQLVARLPGTWIEKDDNEFRTKFLPLVDLNENDWIIFDE